MSSMQSLPLNLRQRWLMSSASLLTFGFLVQFSLPLILFGSTALAALIWVIASICCFAGPCLIVAGKIEIKGLLTIAIAVFLPPAIFIGISNFSNLKVDARATADLVRSLYFFVAFLAGAGLAKRPEVFVRFFFMSLYWTSVLLIGYLVAALVFIDIVDDVELFFGKFDNAVGGRLFLPFPNPYDLALFCTLPIFYFILEKKLALALALTAVLLATQSRTGIVLFALGLLLCIVVSSQARLWSFRFSMMLLATVAITFLLFLDIDDLRSIYLVANTVGLIEGQSTTLSRRFAQWSYLVDLPLLGWGTVRSIDRVIENAVIYELYRTGILGAYSIFCFYFLPALLAMRVLWALGRNPIAVSLAIFVLLTIVGFGSSVFIYQPKLSLMYWFAVGALFSMLSWRQILVKISPAEERRI